ncbi:MAG: endonuclease/exonuclease/phosphatase family protein [Deltaproteobacteria bacterium]|nr:endonuclease/exonuclease/phosphatase family protein [Deltaproteobacteria bacterium]
MIRIVPLCILLLAGCRLAPGPDDGPTLPVVIDPLDDAYLQVGSFNVDWLTADLPGDFEPRNEVDLAMISSLITAMDVDVLAMQEVHGGEAIEVLDLDPVWSFDVGDTGWSQNQVLLYRNDRVALSNVREVGLPINNFPSKDPLVADVQVLGTDVAFTVVALHLNPYGEWSEARYRAEQVRDLVLWLDGAGPGEPPSGEVIVLGDMNDTLSGIHPDIDALQPLEDRYVFATEDTEEYTNVPFQSQIDHIALSEGVDALRDGAGTEAGVTVVKHDRLRPWSDYEQGYGGGQTISDHRPVYVNLELR